MQKPFIKKEVREKYAQRWALLFAKLYQQFKDKETHPAQVCALVLEQVWRDVLGERFANGQSQSQLLRHRLKFLNDEVNRTLDQWCFGQIQLVLLDHQPSALQVLKEQAQGRRVVSFLHSLEEIINFETDRRDFVSFLVHDLIHAGHFFNLSASEGPEEFARQVQFSKWMLHLEESGYLLKLRNAKPDLARAVDYLISDMNTHSWHLIKTLKSLIDQADRPELQTELLGNFPEDLRSHWALVNTDQEDHSLAKDFLQSF